MKIGIIAGIHEDIIRLEEALDLLSKKGCSDFVCLGDIVGYSVPYYGYPSSRSAHECIQLVRERCKYVVAGNHDLFFAKKVPQVSLFDYPQKWYEMDYAQRKSIAHDTLWLYENDLPPRLTFEDIEYLKTLPEYQILQFDKIKVLFTHYIYPNLVGDSRNFTLTNNGPNQHLQFMRKYSCDAAFFSHDLFDNLEVFGEGEVRYLRFGKYRLSKFPVAIKGPWVANGTASNGVLLFDASILEVEAIALNTPPHKIPAWL